MPKYKSTAAYRAADTLNKQIKAIYTEFGPESEVYQLYVNRLTAALPAGTTHVSKGGFLQVSKAKDSGLTAAQIKKAKRGEPSKGPKETTLSGRMKDKPLPSVKEAKTKYKRQIAEEKLAEKGNTAPTESQIQKEAKQVSDEQVKEYVDNKSFVKSYEDSKHKLKYDASVAELMATPGAKSYDLLAAILQEGELRSNAEAQEEAANAGAVEAGYEKGRANLDS